MTLFTTQEKVDRYGALKSYLMNVMAYYKIKPSPKGGSGMYVCPFCGSGEHSKGTGAFSVKDQQFWKCFSCGRSGDVFDLVGKKEGIDNKEEQRKRVIDIIGGDPVPSGIELPAPARNTPPLPKKEKVEEAKRNIKLWHSRVDSTAAQAYLKDRGFTEQTINKFNLGWDDQQQAITIPYPGKAYWTKRRISPGELGKYDKPKSEDLGSEPIFNESALQQSEPVFVCEGQLNAISIEQAGGHAIALGGTSGTANLMRYLQKNNCEAPLILSFDNDEAGKKASQSLAWDLNEKNIKYVPGKFDFDANDCNDINELLQKVPDKLAELIEKNNKEAEKVRLGKKSVEELEISANYLNKGWLEDCKLFSNLPPKKTGFDIYDGESNGGLYPGLYVLGAISSLGKTTLVHQIADQMAKNGEYILYFSLEQTQFELTNKSISRTTALTNGKDKAISAIQIRTDKLSQNQREEVAKAFEDYKNKVKDHMFIVKPSFANTKVEMICDTIKAFIEIYKQKPVVFIDYLQLLEAPEDLRLGDKQKTDYVVKRLKELQSNENLTMIAISSLNRSNYMTPIGFESFKESGMIEYSADVVLGLQLQCLDEKEFNSDTKKDIAKKRELIQKAKARNPRKIKLVCLKNRYGKTNFVDYFDYYPACDLFEEDLATLAKKESINDGKFTTRKVCY
ncbi:DnaB-like helicase C-terminal domain protein [Lactobacillus equicursoris 66c]|uniref:DnaB-like helicase C-terminal domain protein n=1 Tax=Lactobacillus equicursoris 66c TaxID=872326 RepID=K0NMN5_9LACO|nr:DnaB-like helicase C-terminal domain-containing protein [Lactobacillus equicursoris]CCK82919.1 DnaB-like helicase C-terminal domain protein [Lactobacillus equicursoris 66c]